MKKFVLLFGCVCFCLSVFAQTNFQDISFSEALKKAKEENKMVFVDCYTSWCGPCKYMADKVFPQKKLGKYLNDRFVSLKINAEQGEGVDIASKYSVSAYPTFLILKTDGTLIYRIVGGTEGADEFISKVEEGFGEKSAFRMEERYLKGDREEGYLFDFLKSLLASGLDEKAREVAGEILAPLSVEKRCTETYWPIYDNPRLSLVGSENLRFFLKYVDQFRRGVGVEKVNAKLTFLYVSRLEEMLRGRMPATNADLDLVEKELKKHDLEQEDLSNYIEMMRAINAKDTDKIYSLYRKVYQNMSESKLSYLYFRPILLFQGQGKWTEKQKIGFINFTNELIMRMESQVMQLSMQNFVEALPKF